VLRVLGLAAQKDLLTDHPQAGARPVAPSSRLGPTSGTVPCAHRPGPHRDRAGRRTHSVTRTSRTGAQVGSLNCHS
jgi:hypothetical protein